MKGRPLLPFAIIAVVGILLMISISIIGLNQRAAMDEEGEGADTEEVVEFDDPVEAGEQIVNQSCIGCHGGDLSGGSGPALTGLEGKYSAEEIADIVQNGKGAMPAMPHDDAEADAIAQYLLSIE
ncbi:cytochrome c [Halalkalibacterium halodurans]|uniref:cytochrome c550 n=1 Tax=Halalkalibacterium halodurans TaxID=86665 RepID=UPI0010686F96|nr:cytochrome c [Halalkalibacterium halodurans]MED3648249.1 cytochrome c [Halalkalibacterium halodurans]TES56673.1 cytochrome c [Halalkalibacterium halodurans]